MSEALRFNDDKPMMSYFMRSFPKMAEAVARVKEMGAIKYNDGNWKLGNKPDKEYWDSMSRHLNYIFDGEDHDKDTGCLHIAHAVWNLCALLELNYPDLPARDEAIWADRAEHWAEEKRKRKLEQDALYNIDTFDSTEVDDIVADIILANSKSHKSPSAEAPSHVVFDAPSLVFKPHVDEHEDSSTANTLDADEGQKSQSYIESVLGMFGPEKDGFSPAFSAFVRKLATRDDEIRYQYAAHCVEEKRKREASDAALTTDARDTPEIEPPEVAVCPMCSFSFAWRGRYGLECGECGEIFRVPIVPEDEASDDTITKFVTTEMPKPTPASTAFSSVFAASMDKLATRDDEILSQYAARWSVERERRAFKDVKTVEELGAALVARWAAEEKRKREASGVAVEGSGAVANDAADAATYAAFAGAQMSGRKMPGIECPMCDSTAGWRGDCGRECRACGEIFEVPIVPENPPRPKRVRFVIKDAERCPSFNALVDEYFSKPPADWASRQVRGKRNAANATASFSPESLGFKGPEVECPMCGGNYIVWRGERGMECVECDEIFEVPIVPENAHSLKGVRHIIKNANPRSMFGERFYIDTLAGRE